MSHTSALSLTDGRGPEAGGGGGGGGGGAANVGAELFAVTPSPVKREQILRS